MSLDLELQTFKNCKYISVYIWIWFLLFSAERQKRRIMMRASVVATLLCAVVVALWFAPQQADAQAGSCTRPGNAFLKKMACIESCNYQNCCRGRCRGRTCTCSGCDGTCVGTGVVNGAGKGIKDAISAAAGKLGWRQWNGWAIRGHFKQKWNVPTQKQPWNYLLCHFLCQPLTLNWRSRILHVTWLRKKRPENLQ